ncbi:MAG: hypothetical protein ABII90_08080 [Bacteroidota bacterium]
MGKYYTITARRSFIKKLATVLAILMVVSKKSLLFAYNSSSLPEPIKDKKPKCRLCADCLARFCRYKYPPG